MNRKQSWTVYVAGVVLAAGSAIHGNDQSDWFFEFFVPVFILAAVAVFAFRPRPNTPRDDMKIVAVIAVVVLGAAVYGRADARLRSIESSADGAAEEARMANAAADEAHSEAESAKRAAEETRDAVQLLEYRR